MAEIQWWYARNDNQLGPVSAAELRRLALSGELTPLDLVWREGMAEWAPAARLKGLFPDAKDQTAATALPEAGLAPAKTGAGESAEMPPLPPVDLALPLSTPPEPPTEPTIALAFPASQILPPASPTVQRPFEAEPAVERLRVTVTATRLALVLALVQGLLWGTCILVVLFGGLLFTIARLRAKTPAAEAASAAVFATCFLGAYVVARAGEKIARLVEGFVQTRRK